MCLTERFVSKLVRNDTSEDRDFSKLSSGDQLNGVFGEESGLSVVFFYNRSPKESGVPTELLPQEIQSSDLFGAKIAWLET